MLCAMASWCADLVRAGQDIYIQPQGGTVDYTTVTVRTSRQMLGYTQSARSCTARNCV